MSTSGTKKSRLILVFAVLLVGVIGFSIWWTLPTRLRKLSDSNVGPSRTEAGEGAHGRVSEEIQIHSDTLTSTGRVVRMSRGDKQSEIVIPPGMSIPIEELKALAFPDPPRALAPRPPGAGLNRRLYFYGLTLDEQTNVLAGVTIECQVTLIRPEEKPQVIPMRLTSESDGRFTLDLEWGQSLLITISKEGYISPPAEVFRYGPIGVRNLQVADIRHPVRFILHKKKPQEQLFAFSRWFGAPHMGEPVRVDLSTGQIVPNGGDLIVSIDCPEPYTEQKRFPWKMSVQAVDGGLVEVPSYPPGSVRLENLHEAPSEGYTSGFALSYDENSADYRVQHEGTYYLKSRDGQTYAKLNFRMNTSWGERGVPFKIEGVVNTNASRNLQTPVLK